MPLQMCPRISSLRNVNTTKEKWTEGSVAKAGIFRQSKRKADGRESLGQLACKKPIVRESDVCKKVDPGGRRLNNCPTHVTDAALDNYHHPLDGTSYPY